MNSSGFTFRRVREDMIENLLDMGIKDFRVLDAMSQVPRHLFIEEALWSRAYENRSLTIGYKQTISQPYIVARMTELLIEKTSGRGKIFKKIIKLFASLPWGLLWGLVENKKLKSEVWSCNTKERFNKSAFYWWERKSNELF